MNCPKCCCSDKVKSGKIKELQRYRCKSCGCNYTVAIKSSGYSDSYKQQALHLYLEGLGFRSIGRLLKVSNVSVLNWIRNFGNRVPELHSESQKIDIVEVDELHTYVGQKKTLLDMDCSR
jgi:transposase-like protein